MKNNKILIICVAILLFIFLVFGTYAWYLFFLKASGDFDINNNSNLKDGNIVFKDNGNSVYDADASIVEDEQVDSVEAYSFQVINYGDEDSYNLYIEDVPLNSIDDGCTSETLLSRSQLKYQLKLNGTVIKEDYLSNINDNILDTRSISKDATNNYELRIYIHEDATDWIGKHYHYKVVLNNGK